MFIIINFYFLTPVLNSQGMKKLRYAIQKSTKILMADREQRGDWRNTGT